MKQRVLYAPMIGKTIRSAELIAAEYGRTYDRYLCLTFTDGTRLMLGTVVGGPEAVSPNPWRLQRELGEPVEP
jgi:hypothetical protein